MSEFCELLILKQLQVFQSFSFRHLKSTDVHDLEATNDPDKSMPTYDPHEDSFNSADFDETLPIDEKEPMNVECEPQPDMPNVNQSLFAETEAEINLNQPKGLNYPLCSEIVPRNVLRVLAPFITVKVDADGAEGSQAVFIALHKKNR